jgi:hypothetical protein
MPGQPPAFALPRRRGAGVNKGKPLREYDLEVVRAAEAARRGSAFAPAPGVVDLWGVQVRLAGQ